jgi:hypothetical protein
MTLKPDRWITVNRWEEFQHYKHRRPTWIKNYVRLVNDDTYLGLSLIQRGVIHGLWMMYAAGGGKPLSEAVARRVLVGSEAEARRWLNSVEALNHAGFIDVSASETLAYARAGARSRELEKYLSTSRAVPVSRYDAPTGPNERPWDQSILKSVSEEVSS